MGIKKILSFIIVVFVHIIFICCLIFSFYEVQNSANKIKEIYTYSGLFGLYFFASSLSFAMLNRIRAIFNLFQVIPKICGNYALIFITLHFLNFIILDSKLSPGFILKEIALKSFLLLGFSGFIVMIFIFFASLKKQSRAFLITRNLGYIGLLLASLHYFYAQKVALLPQYFMLIFSIILLLVRAFFLLKNKS
ncbi:MAG: hypothetical protein K2P17_06560 [Helicobacteraceae bacterium]|nr:hypothetical protein [Helicobacteraceae bacterium]